MSYFAKPNFIVYDEWFDDDFKKTKLDVKNEKTKTTSNIHDFFYKQSNFKVGASENNLQFDINVNEKKLFTNYYLEKHLEKYTSVSSKNFWFFGKLYKSNLELNIIKNIIISLSIIGFLLIFGLLLLFGSQSKKNKTNITNKSFIIEKEVLFSKKIL